MLPPESKLDPRRRQRRCQWDPGARFPASQGRPGAQSSQAIPPPSPPYVSTMVAAITGGDDDSANAGGLRRRWRQRQRRRRWSPSARVPGSLATTTAPTPVVSRRARARIPRQSWSALVPRDDARPTPRISTKVAATTAPMLVVSRRTRPRIPTPPCALEPPGPARPPPARLDNGGGDDRRRRQETRVAGSQGRPGARSSHAIPPTRPPVRLDEGGGDDSADAGGRPARVCPEPNAVLELERAGAARSRPPAPRACLDDAAHAASCVRSARTDALSRDARRWGGVSAVAQRVDVSCARHGQR